MALTELLPCPFCGRPVCITELTVENHPAGNYYEAKIECGCGLTFEREWIDAHGLSEVVIFNEDIATAWNTRPGSSEKGE